jgi:selT/selW/selH-like putative selenoprotein
LADAVGERFAGVEVELIEGSGGAFEVRRDGELIFSKLQAGRFPEDAEIFEALDG